MSIDVRNYCPHHGFIADILDIGEIRLCGKCVVEKLEVLGVKHVEMKTIEGKKDVSGGPTIKCEHCGFSRPDTRAACPCCGYQVGR
jgi:hypothetical protein